MKWLNKRLQKEHDHTETSSKIEVVAHKNATKEEINRAREATKTLNEVVTANGFTLKIYLAAGGRYNTAHKGKT